MYTVGGLVQQLKNFNEDLSLETLLEKEEFASLLQNIYTALPVKPKSTAQRLFCTKIGTKKEKTRSAALTAILEIRDIILPDDIHGRFQTWKENPAQFWKAPGAQLGACWDSVESLENVATEAYLIVRQLGLRRLWDTILWRFYVNFFYNLALMLGNGRAYITHHLCQPLLKILQQSKKITDEFVVIEKNLQSWTAAGSRYHKICLCLGGGALFLLPQVSDKVWEDEHALKGSDFDIAMAHLKHQGIMELSDQLGADELSNRIQNSALEPFRWNVTLPGPAPRTSVANVRELTIEAGSGALNSNPSR